jgi:hypothetical protein
MIEEFFSEKISYVIQATSKNPANNLEEHKINSKKFKIRLKDFRFMPLTNTDGNGTVNTTEEVFMTSTTYTVTVPAHQEQAFNSFINAIGGKVHKAPAKSEPKPEKTEKPQTVATFRKGRNESDEDAGVRYLAIAFAEAGFKDISNKPLRLKVKSRFNECSVRIRKGDWIIQLKNASTKDDMVYTGMNVSAAKEIFKQAIAWFEAKPKAEKPEKPKPEPKPAGRPSKLSKLKTRPTLRKDRKVTFVDDKDKVIGEIPVNTRSLSAEATASYLPAEANAEAPVETETVETVVEVEAPIEETEVEVEETEVEETEAETDIVIVPDTELAGLVEPGNALKVDNFVYATVSAESTFEFEGEVFQVTWNLPLTPGETLTQSQLGRTFAKPDDNNQFHHNGIYFKVRK